MSFLGPFRVQQFGALLEGVAANRPPINAFPFTQVTGTIYSETDSTLQWITAYVAVGVLGWIPFNPSGVAAGVASVNAGTAISITGPVANPVVNVSVAGESDGDLFVRAGGTWTRLPVGAAGEVLTVVGAAPSWQPAGGGGVTVAGGDGIVVTGGPAYSVAQGYAGQAKGDLSYFNGANWVRFPIGAVGQVPTVNLDPVDPQIFWRSIFGEEPANIDLVGGINLTSRFGFAAQATGDLVFCTGVYPTQWQRLPIGTAGQVLTVSGGSVSWATPAVTTPNTDIYVAGVTGSDLNDGLTALTPVQTLSRAMQLVPSVIPTGSYCTIHGAAEPVTETGPLRWNFPAIVGDGAKGLLFDFALTQELAPDVMVGGSQGVGTTFGDVQSTVALVPQAYKGLILEYLTAGPNQGLYRIASNTVAKVTICGSFPAAPVVGDSYRVLREQTVTLPAVPSNLSLFFGGPATFSGVNFELNSSVLVVRAPVGINASSWRSTSGFLLVTQLGRIFQATTLLSSTPSIGFQTGAGPEILTSTAALDGGEIDLGQFRLETSFTIAARSGLRVQNGYCTGLTNFEINNSSLEASSLVGDTPSASQGFIQLKNGSVGQVFSLLCTANATGSAVVVDSNSYLTGADLNGAGNAGYGLNCQRLSHCQVGDAGAGSALTGALGDVQVGSNAATSTWAAIAGGALADVTDLTAAVPTMAAVQTT